MKNNKIQFMLCLIISVLCWNNGFGMSETFEDTYCEQYALETNQSGDIVEFTIYNITDFGPYYPEVVEWYIPELGSMYGDSVSVTLDLSQTSPNFPLTLCVDYIADGYPCTLCTNINPAEANCEYQLVWEVYGLELWGSVYPTNWQSGTPPSDVTWILEGGGGVIGTGQHLNYTFDEPGTYLICAEYTDELTECEGVLCDSIVINGVNELCDYDLAITQNGLEIAAILMDSIQNFPSSVTWILENGGGVIGNGPFLNYQFSEPGEYIICAEYFDDWTSCAGVMCEDIVVSGGNTGTCSDFDFWHEIQGDSAVFQVFYPDIYEVNEDSIVWYLDGQVIAYGNPVNYNLPISVGVFTVCADVQGFNIQTGEWCITEICHEITTNCPPIPITSAFVNDSMVTFELPVIIEPFVLENTAWYVNGNQAGQGDAFTYVFSESGNYIICVVADVTDLDGNLICSTEGCINIEVTGQQNNDCEAHFEWQDNGSPDGTLYSVGFANLSTGNYTNATWNFGDGNTGSPTEDSFVHLYEDLGVYNVCLTVWNNIGCQDTYCELVLVSGTPPTDECDYEIIHEVVVGNIFAFALVASDSTLIEAEWYNGQTGEGYGMTDTNISIVFTNYGINEICAAYETPFGGSCSGTICTTVIVENPECENTDCVFPGDADRNMIVDNYDVLPIGLHFGETGPVRSDATIGWYGQPATDWQITSDTLDLKHVDCNGDGEIFFDDIDAIEQNYNRTHNGVTANRVEEGAPGLHLEFGLDTIYSSPDTGNIVINADIIMGTSNLPVEEVYGVAFSVAYPADLVDSSSVVADYFMDSWIGDPTTTLQLEKNVVSQSVVDFAYSRTDQQNISGFGQIGSVSFVMTDNIIGKLSSDVELNFSITNVRAILNTGEEILIMGSENVIVVDINDTSTATNNPDLSQHINIFPNPTPNTINLTINDLQAQTLTLYNTVGQQVLARPIVSTDTQIDVSQLPSGMYLLSIQTDKGLYNEKIIIE